MPSPPDFIGVGALGSGTGWWHKLLLAHPEIRAPEDGRRALHHFDRFCATEMTDVDIAAYHAHFPRREGTITGEWTGRYLFDPWTPPLLKRAAPEAKLLVLLSDPIERYRATFADRLAKREGDETIYMADVVDRRSYASQLARLDRFFDPAQVLVLQYERCRRDPAGEYRRTLEFLGVRDTAFLPRRVLGRRAALAVAVARRLPLPGATRRKVAERASGAPEAQATAPLWPDLEAALHTALDPQVARLDATVPGFDVSLWPNFAGQSTGT
jgi:Sulfotransferase family